MRTLDGHHHTFYQSQKGEIIPVEVESADNVKAISLRIISLPTIPNTQSSSPRKTSAMKTISKPYRFTRLSAFDEGKSVEKIKRYY